MGNYLNVEFVFGKEEKVEKLEDLQLEKLLTAIAGDIYSQKQTAEIRQRILSSTIFTGERGGRVEVQVGKSYWFSLTAYENKSAYVGLSVDETFLLDERAMSDFAKRAKRAFTALKPWYGYAETDESIDALREAYGSEVKPNAHVCWLNYYSQKLVDEIGRDKLLSAARKTAQSLGDVTIDELADIAITLQVGKMPGYVENLPKFKAIEKELFGKPCKYDAKRV